MKQKLSNQNVKHDAILKAAMRLFLKHGYIATTMDEIANAAGVTKQTVYAHHKSKEKLFVSMLSALCSRNMPTHIQLERTDVPFETLLESIGLAVLNTITSPEGLGATRLVISESAHHRKLAALYYERGTKQIVQFLSDFLACQKKNAAIKIKNPESAASYFLAMLKGQYYIRMMLRAKPVPSQKQKEAHVREVVNIFMHIYGARNPIKTRSIL